MFIPKTLVSDISSLKPYFDGNPIVFSSESQGDSWLISFSYFHSTHNVAINLGSALPLATTTPPLTGESSVITYITIGIVVIVVAVVTAAVVLRRRK